MFDTHIPAPQRRGNSVKYPFVLLQPGQSVLHECNKVNSKIVRTAAYGIAKRHGWEIVVRWDKTGIRVWRVK